MRLYYQSDEEVFDCIIMPFKTLTVVKMMISMMME